EAVPVYVPGRRDREAVVRSGLVPLRDPVGIGGEPGRAAEVRERAPFLDFAVLERVRADDDVGETVAVDVSRARDREAELRTRAAVLGDPGGGGGERSGSSEVYG